MKNIKKGILDGLQDEFEKINAIVDIKNIDINMLKPSEENFYKIEHLEELQKDISEHGLYHNLLVKQVDENTFRIVSGHRRYHALKNLNYKEVPCKVIDNSVSDVDIEIIMIKANATSRELDDDTKRFQVKRLEELYRVKKGSGEEIKGKLRDNIGQDLGISGVQVQKYMSINKKLIPELKDLLDSKELSVKNAFDYSKFDEEQQKEIYTLLSQTIGDKKEIIENLNKELLGTKEEAKGISEENEKLQGKVSQLSGELESKSNELLTVTDNIDDIKKQIKEEALNESNVELSSLKEKLKDLEEEKERIENEKSVLEQDVEQAKELDTEKVQLDVKAEIMAKNLKDIASTLLKTIKGNAYAPSEDNKKLLKSLKNKELKSLIELIEAL
jgi:ParB family chromosome partitioning protein